MFLVYVILAFALTMILSVLLLRAGMVVMVRRAGAHIEEALGLIEYITNTRTVPQGWQEPFARQLAQLQHRNPDKQRKQIRIRQAARKTYLKKLTKLMTYTQNSPIIQDEETRRLLLADLSAVYEEWKTQDWELPSSQPQEGS